MKITDSEVIRNGERELIDAITADLDWGAVEGLFRKEHNLGIDEEVEYKRGDIVVHDDRVAYQLEFDVKVTLSILVDREGNCLSLTSSGDSDMNQEEPPEQHPEGEEKSSPMPPPPDPDDRISMAVSQAVDEMAELTHT